MKLSFVLTPLSCLLVHMSAAAYVPQDGDAASPAPEAAVDGETSADTAAPAEPAEQEPAEQEPAEQEPAEAVAPKTVTKQKKPAPAPKAEGSGDDEGPGFFAKHYPFGLNDNLEPEVENNLLGIWVLEALLGLYGGPLYVPKLMADVDPGPEYSNEALWLWIWDAVLKIGTVPCAFSGVICFGVGIYVSYFAWIAHVLARSLYFNPVSTINLYDRHIKKTRGKTAQRNRFMEDAFLRETSVASTDVLTPTMAY